MYTGTERHILKTNLKFYDNHGQQGQKTVISAETAKAPKGRTLYLSGRPVQRWLRPRV
jgi:hypothetical protein